RLLAGVLRCLCRGQRHHERGHAAALGAARHRAQLRLHVGSDRHRLSLRTLFHVPAGPGEYIIPLASCPFGFGWHLFGTSGSRVDFGMVGARFAWLTAVTAILIGHIAAVYLAHVKAMQVLDTRRMALRSQVPLTALMVVYTFVSLSILAEPIVERR